MNSKIPFLEIIEWVDPNPNVLLWKVPDQDKEIKNGAQLIVRESQSVLFLNEGQLADVFKPGRHTLSTKNIPILSKLKGWKYGFESPFKADVYYISTKQFISLKWGTPAPILMRDPQFGQVRVKAFGSYNISVVDEKKFFNEYAGTFPLLTITELETQLRDYIAPMFGEVLANANISVLDIAGNISELNKKVKPLVAPYFERLGIAVTEFVITSATLPKEVTEFYDKTTSMNMIGDMDRFQQFNTAVATSQEGGPIQRGVQDGLSAMMMAQMVQNQQNMVQSNKANVDDPMQKLQQLKTMFDNQLIDEEEYKTKKAEILKTM